MPRPPGRPRTPTNVVELRGNPSKLSKAELEERAAEEIRARPLRPEAPGDLTPKARECWDALAPELEALGLLSVLDGPSFRLACEAYALATYALEAMLPKNADGTPDRRRKRPELLEVDRVHGGQLRKHPAFMVYRQASAEFRAWCVEFGLSPSARVRLRPGAIGATSSETVGRDDDDESFFGT